MLLALATVTAMLVTGVGLVFEMADLTDGSAGPTFHGQGFWGPPVSGDAPSEIPLTREKRCYKISQLAPRVKS